MLDPDDNPHLSGFETAFVPSCHINLVSLENFANIALVYILSIDGAKVRSETFPTCSSTYRLAPIVPANYPKASSTWK